MLRTLKKLLILTRVSLQNLYRWLHILALSTIGVVDDFNISTYSTEEIFLKFFLVIFYYKILKIYFLVNVNTQK